eukprot:c24616_g1_i1 orf=67-1890(+)
MGKDEEYRVKKRNKATRKRLNNTVDFTQGVQAAKRRRKAGRRRVCEGMCYTLPTPDDPYNDLYKEKIAKKKGKKDQEDGDDDLHTKLGNKQVSKIEFYEKKSRAKTPKANGSSLSEKVKKTGSQRSGAKESDGSLTEMAIDGLANHTVSNGQKDALHGELSITEKVKWKPSCERCLKENDSWTCVGGDAFEIALCTLLNASIITDEQLETNVAIELNVRSEKVCIGSKWYWVFWEACGTGSDVLATGRAANTFTQIGGVLAAVAHIAARRVHQILSSNPIVLFVVQSKEQALQVRSIFKVLKSLLGLHAVSLHTGTPLQHQIEGLRSTSAEILIATPDRLCDLLVVNAVSLSNVSFMVVDGLEDIISCGFSDQLIHIKAKVADNVQTILSTGTIPHSLYTICQTLLSEPICRVISNTCVSQCSACISQNVHVLVSEDKRQQKLHKIVRDHFESRESGTTLGGLLVLFRQSEPLLNVKVVVQEEGYSVDCIFADTIKEDQSASCILEQFRKGQVEVLLSTEEHVGLVDLAAIGTIVYYEFPSTLDLYRQTLMKMARYTVNGKLHSFCSGATAPLALQLVKVLQECLQPIPSSLRMLAEAAQLVEQKKA